MKPNTFNQIQSFQFKANKIFPAETQSRREEQNIRIGELTSVNQKKFAQSPQRPQRNNKKSFPQGRREAEKNQTKNIPVETTDSDVYSLIYQTISKCRDTMPCVSNPSSN